jgi:hypothetical protein
MVSALLTRCTRLDNWLHEKFGRPYGVVLTVGLILEIGHRMTEAPNRLFETSHVVQLVLLILLDAALLLHQLGELGERLSRRTNHRSEESYPK